MECCCRYEVEWEPGTRSQYDPRAGFLLAAEAVRSQLPGRPGWETLCREWLWEPIGAEGLTFTPPPPGAISITPQPRELNPAMETVRHGHHGLPGGGCMGRLEDIIRVLQLHLNGGRWEGRTLIHPEELAEMHRIQYRQEILRATAQGRTPDYEPFGLGWKIKLNQTDDGFGLGNRTEEGVFGHAGIECVLGVGVPRANLAIAFVTTQPVPSAELARVRNTLTDLLADAVK